MYCIWKKTYICLKIYNKYSGCYKEEFYVGLQPDNIYFN